MTRLRLFLFVAAWVILTASMEANEGAILLHGLCRTSSSMTKMEGQLAAAGYSVVNVDYPSRAAPIDRALADPKLRGCSRINFVTHSLGGILVRSYFKRHNSGRLGRVVMLGPPNQGSEVVDKLGGWWLFKKINGSAGADLGTCRFDDEKTHR